MTPEELEEALSALEAAHARAERERERLRQEHERLRREFDVLEGKLRFPGTRFLVDLEYQLVYEGSIVAIMSTLTTSEPIETLPGALHAVYALSAYAPSTSVPLVINDGSVIVAPSDAVTVAIQRQVLTGPTRTEARVAVYNSSASGDHTIAVRVWRRLGMGS